MHADRRGSRPTSMNIVNSRQRAQPIVVLPSSSRETRVNRSHQHQSFPSRNHRSTVAFPLFYEFPFSSRSSDSGLADSIETRNGLDILVSASTSLPTYYTDMKCPICSKKMAHDQIEEHMAVCLSKPIVFYNDDTATSNLGECVICFDDMEEGSTIARLPCLCVYHKMCIDKWFGINRCCPKHPEGVD